MQQYLELLRNGCGNRMVDRVIDHETDKPFKIINQQKFILNQMLLNFQLFSCSYSCCAYLNINTENDMLGEGEDELKFCVSLYIIYRHLVCQCSR